MKDILHIERVAESGREWHRESGRERELEMIYADVFISEPLGNWTCCAKQINEASCQRSVQLRTH
jgi:hypothetical protein